jgi:fido (protein-threonine AMPylation protein)
MLTSRINKQRSQLAELERSLVQGDLELTNGRSVSAEDLAHLTEVHQYLEERFSRHLNLLRSRAERT